MATRLHEHLSHYQRELTPVPFARYLVGLVADMFRCNRVAVLWCSRRTRYWKLGTIVDMWGPTRDAMRYDGPYPIVAHPPCGPWGKYKHSCKMRKDDGIRAIELVHRWGGVVEQPLGSQLFRLHGDGRKPLRVNQCDYGHLAIKATILYVVSHT